ncbi:MAG TPA: hypothetical protein VK034_05195 [Enhygromyxa sp.]|nr:hypothetical protein [Enhygromyxa sp.]
MSAWTNGKLHVVVGPAGLSVHRGGRAELILSTAQLGGPLPGKKGKTGRARIHPLAVTADGKVAFTIDAERKLIRAALESGGPSTKFPWDISDLAPADGAQVFAAFVTGTKARALTSIVIGVPPADPKAKWDHEFEAERPTKVEWPDELLWDKAPWSRKTRWTIQPDLLLVDANSHGYAVYDTDSAVVGVLRRPSPGALPTGFNAVHRTPKDKGTTVAATTTARGVLVATCKPDGAAVLAEFDDAGKLLAHRKLEATAIGPLTHAGGRVFALVEHRKLAILGLDLTDQTEIELANLPPSQARLRAGADGASFLLALADKVIEGSLDNSGWTLRELDLSKVPAPGKAHEATIAEAAIDTPEEPVGADGKPIDTRTRIITQAPRLDLDPNQPNEAWQFVRDEDFEIVLNAVSVGGPAETGLYVEVSGAALDKGLVEPVTVDIEGQNRGHASFERHGSKRIATFPDLRIPAGVEPIRDKKIKPKERFLDNPEDTFLTIRLRGRVPKLGANELLFVRVGFERVQEGSLMRGRPVSVFETRPEPPPRPPEPTPEPASEPGAEPTSNPGAE